MDDHVVALPPVDGGRDAVLVANLESCMVYARVNAIAACIMFSCTLTVNDTGRGKSA